MLSKIKRTNPTQPNQTDNIPEIKVIPPSTSRANNSNLALKGKDLFNQRYVEYFKTPASTGSDSERIFNILETLQVKFSGKDFKALSLPARLQLVSTLNTTIRLNNKSGLID